MDSASNTERTALNSSRWLLALLLLAADSKYILVAILTAQVDPFHKRLTLKGFNTGQQLHFFTSAMTNRSTWHLGHSGVMRIKMLKSIISSPHNPAGGRARLTPQIEYQRHETNRSLWIVQMRRGFGPSKCLEICWHDVKRWRKSPSLQKTALALAEAEVDTEIN